jgi:hypothetical protein
LDGFEWTVGDIVTISGTCVAPEERTVATVVPTIGNVAILEAATVDNENNTWTVSHTVVTSEAWARASLGAVITDSEGSSGAIAQRLGTIYPVDGDTHVYVYSGPTGAFCVEDGDFITMDE